MCAAVISVLLAVVSVSLQGKDDFEFRSESLPFRHFDHIRAALLPEDNGSGVAVGDFDNDGYDDIYLPNLAGPALMPREQLVANRSPGRLFKNLGDGKFSDITDASGLRHVGWGMGAVWADVNDDGWLDLLITGLDEVTLFLSESGRTFRNASAEYGLGVVPCFASGAAIADYDGDGDLDIYVPCYLDFPLDQARDRSLVGGRPAPMTTPASYPAQRNLLFRNDGERFVDVAEKAGVEDPMGRGLQALFADLNDDQIPDLYVANDQSFDKLFLNMGDGTFSDTSLVSGTRDPRAGMGIALGDYDSDGKPDLFLTHWVGEQNALYRNLSTADTLLFDDVAFSIGLAPVDNSWVGWGSALADFDLDGDLDLFVVNGSTIEDEWTKEVLSDPKMIPQPLRIYGQEGGRFTDASDSAGEIFSRLLVGRGAAFGDFNRDGLLDAVVSVHNGEPMVLWNRSPPNGGWLEIELEGRSPNRFAVGAKVSVIAGDTQWAQQIVVGESFLSDSSYRLHFGLGNIKEATVQVVWPSGLAQVFEKVLIGQTVRLREGEKEWNTASLRPQTPSPRGSSGTNEAAN